MSNQLNQYINISATDKWSSVFAINRDDSVKRNGVEDIAKNIKLGDHVEFNYKGKPYTIDHVRSIHETRYEPTCFSGGSFVYGPNRQEQRVNRLRVGDLVMNAKGEYVRITHVIKTMVWQEIDMYCHTSTKLLITGYHPVQVEKGVWQFPAECDAFKCQNEWTAAVYSLAVEDRSPIYVNDVIVATLGHNQIGPVIEHEYFGTDAVLRDIERLSEGKYAVINMSKIRRSGETGKVVSIA